MAPVVSLSWLSIARGKLEVCRITYAIRNRMNFGSSPFTPIWGFAPFSVRSMLMHFDRTRVNAQILIASIHALYIKDSCKCAFVTPVQNGYKPVSIGLTAPTDLGQPHHAVEHLPMIFWRPPCFRRRDSSMIRSHSPSTFWSVYRVLNTLCVFKTTLV